MHKIHSGTFTADNVLHLYVYNDNDTANVYQESWLELLDNNNTMLFKARFYKGGKVISEKNTMFGKEKLVSIPSLN